MLKYLLLFLLVCSTAFTQGDFKNGQLRYKRVRTAFAEKETAINSRLDELGVEPQNLVLFLRGLKKERKLEAWVKNSNDSRFQLYKSFDFCSFSGNLGPKRQQGDGQIPEGLYKIEIFNPVSSFYLSMSVSYPNSSDRKRASASDPGGDIYIHGNCVTIGCIPITDNGIKELYALTVLAKDANHSPINVHLFPGKMDHEALEAINAEYPDHTAFWQELTPFYRHFEEHRELPGYTISSSGEYRIQ